MRPARPQGVVHHAPAFGWQRNYYEHVIRNDRSLDRIRAYIETNAAKWHDDRFYPSQASR